MKTPAWTGNRHRLYGVNRAQYANIARLPQPACQPPSAAITATAVTASGRLSCFARIVMNDALCPPPCRTAAYTGGVLSALAKLFKQIALFFHGHIPPGCNFSAGAMTAKTIAARRINLTD